MIILGVDPGTAITGYGVVEYLGNRFRPLAYSCIRTTPELDLPRRLLVIHQEITALIREFQPNQVAVEELFFNRNTTTALAVGQARGAVLLACAQAELPVFEYTPLQVKQAVVGYGRAEKQQVQAMVKAILNLPGVPKPDDVADALALAICHAHSNYSLLGRMS
ncbi:Holliday junction endonuclease RuvC [Carboxydocella sporoproducens DSM 16521]|uniref:Crossover junction endodeoxyribonuclease RuvC n=2 Tax=Carboxydocella TaxID=178898 RepID=A0A1T4SMC5_9FIRM|nr:MULTISPECIES: crossover junction endodeoxyribonuclease RuvC [Carboxydocella]AVX21478.1 Holliday junction endonuclease RuvC [Carboxydocella thermautotrophica]SKA29048.1 Holliday junction endonuclease RuvC [Carboxydocella sporoproducens DSM 16521]